MSEHALSLPVSKNPEVLAPAERRGIGGGERRAEPVPGRRSSRQSLWMRWLGIAGRDLAIIVVALAAIVYSVRNINPIFANQPTVAASLTKKVPVVKAALAPTPADTSRAAQLVASPKFESDRRAFAASLVATGHMERARADSVAYYAVRESYLDGIPPAVVFGVMLTENSLFVSSAMSNVGAVGLMQVYPKVWLKALSAKFGKNLAADSTNLKYGIYILKQYIKSDSGGVTPSSVTSGLLHYNGCVHGTNTRNCYTYPTKVKTYVEKQGGSICGGKGFYDCIAKPFISGLFGRRQDVTTTQ